MTDYKKIPEQVKKNNLTLLLVVGLVTALCAGIAISKGTSRPTDKDDMAASAAASHKTASAGQTSPLMCVNAGPQAPRDIMKKDGLNTVAFAPAPPASEMHLCDIHFHHNAEHKGLAYQTAACEGEECGYVCSAWPKPEQKAGGGTHHVAMGHDAHGEHGEQHAGCANVAKGDTIEVHWVYTSCDVKPGPTLASCLSPTCKNPKLRVEARVFHLTDKASAVDFGKISNFMENKNYLPTPKNPVTYAGSTTGPKYTQKTCSPFHVTWNVGSACTPLNLASLHKWCGKDKNVFREDHAHGVRKLVTDLKLLAPVK